MPPFGLCNESISIEHQVINVVADLTQWNLIGFKTTHFRDFLSKAIYNGDASKDEGIGTWTYGGIPLGSAISLYTTVYATRVYCHNSGVPMTCQVQVQFKGFLRKLMVNSNRLLGGASSDPST